VREFTALDVAMRCSRASLTVSPAAVCAASIVRELDHVLCRFLMVDLPIEKVSLQIKLQRIQWMQHT
jgi:hypothetical protein